MCLEYSCEIAEYSLQAKLVLKAAWRQRVLVEAAFELAAEIESTPVQTREYCEAKLTVAVSP